MMNLFLIGALLVTSAKGSYFSRRSSHSEGHDLAMNIYNERINPFSFEETFAGNVQVDVVANDLQQKVCTINYKSK